VGPPASPDGGATVIRATNMFTSKRRLALMTAALLGLQLAVPMNASAAAAAVTLDQLLQQVKNTRATEAEQNAQRLKDFTANRAQQASVLAEAEKAQVAAEARSKALSAEFDNNEKEINEVTTLLTTIVKPSDEGMSVSYKLK